MKEFLLISNILKVDISLPITIIDNCILRKANHIEISKIDDQLEKFGVSRFYYKDDSYMDTEGVLILKNTSPFEGNYFILEYDDDHIDSLYLSMSFWLSSLQLHVELSFSIDEKTKNYKGSYRPGSVVNFYHDTFYRPDKFKSSYEAFWRLTKSDIYEVKKIYESINLLGKKNSYLSKAILAFNQIKNISSDARIRSISYFAVLECLLTNKPNDNDPYSSIRRQLSKKLIFLNQRMHEPIDYKKFLSKGNDEFSFENLVKKLYDYRSTIAHGGDIDFIKNFKLLINSYNTDELLNEITRKVLLYSLEEPELVRGIHDL